MDDRISLNESRRFRTIEILRGCSALAVAMFHFNEPYPALFDCYHVILKWGWLGVTAFFVISGFCIASTRTKDKLLPFWERRLLRIYPAYWASLVVVFGVITLRLFSSGVNDVTQIPSGFSAWFYTLAALTVPASKVPGINWVYWSLGYELAFYIIVGFLFRKESGVLIVFFSITALIASSLGYPFNQWGPFGVGIASYLFVERQYRTAAFLAAICTFQTITELSALQGLLNLVIGILIIFPPAFIISSMFEPLKAVGTFSYSLYLIHVPIGCYLIPHYLSHIFTRQLVSSILQDAVLLLSCLVFSYWFYLVIEKPTHEYARRKSTLRRKASTAV